MRALIEAIAITEAPPRAGAEAPGSGVRAEVASAGAAAAIVSATPRTLTALTRSHSAASSSAVARHGGTTPALATTTSRWPKRSIVVATAARRASGSVTSAASAEPVGRRLGDRLAVERDATRPGGRERRGYRGSEPVGGAGDERDAIAQQRREGGRRGRMIGHCAIIARLCG